MNKFAYENSSDASKQWEFCEKEKYPYIVINNNHQNYSEIFYDITNISNDLEKISDDVKNISLCYSEFFCIPGYIAEEYQDQYYYFKFPVHKDHAEFIANQLFDYLYNKIFS